MHYIKENFEYSDIYADKFVLYQCGDNTAVNIKATRIMNTPQISYKHRNSLLRHNKMVEDDELLHQITSSVCEFTALICGFKKASTALPNTALILSQHSSLRAKTKSATQQ